MMKRSLILCCAVFALMVVSAGSAEAQSNVACFDWVCTGTYCSFDSSCSEFDAGPLWRYRWDFGDGTWPVLTGSSTIDHTYTNNNSTQTVSLTVLSFWTDPVEVVCNVQTSLVGPPVAISGRCSS